MQKSEKSYFSLLNFSGAGSKLLQAQLGNADDVFTIPAYPLVYLPLFFREWQKENKTTSAAKILKLILKHHKSILDSRFIKGFNGLSGLGKNKSSFIKISEIKFKKSFLKFLKNKEISQKNVIMAIHHAYQYAINDKSKNIFYHAHGIEIFNKHVFDNFQELKVLAITRDPIYNFWRRAYADEKIEQARYDITDCEYIKNYRYINRLRDLYINFKNLNNKFKKNCKFYTFENLKINNFQVLKKICSFLKIKFNYKKIRTPRYQNKTWWNPEIYKGYNTEKDIVKDSFSYEEINKSEDLELFSNHEIFVLEMALLPFMIKFNFRPRLKPKKKILNNFKFFLQLLLPTKYGFNLFFSRFSYKNLTKYICALFEEAFGKKKIKNYYFNAMYRFNWAYRITYLIKINFFRKLLFQSKNNYIVNILYFFSKILIYFFLQLELIALYFVRIYLILYLYFTVKNKVKYMNLA